MNRVCMELKLIVMFITITNKKINNKYIILYMDNIKKVLI